MIADGVAAALGAVERCRRTSTAVIAGLDPAIHEPSKRNAILRVFFAGSAQPTLSMEYLGIPGIASSSDRLSEIAELTGSIMSLSFLRFATAGMVSLGLAGCARTTKTFTAFVALASVLIVIFSRDARSQTSDQSATAQYLQYFLDAPPTNFDRARLPSDARGVIIAKVLNLMQPPAYLIGRGGLSSPLPRDLFFTRIQIVDVLSGRARVAARYDVYFGVPGRGQQIYPHTPRQNMREYFVMSYASDDDKRRLLSFPATEPEYSGWEKEVSEYERLRSRPGHRDQRP